MSKRLSIILSVLIFSWFPSTSFTQQINVEAGPVPGAVAINDIDLFQGAENNIARLILEIFRRERLARYETSRVEAARKSFRTLLQETIENEFSFWNDGSIHIETDSAVVSHMQSYWAVTGLKPSVKQIQDSNWQDKNPWSAAFVSWAVKTSGAGNNFRYTYAHAEYIVWARNNTRFKNNLPKAYAVNDLRSAWPQPGDLLCKNRSGKNYTLTTLSRDCISHCDIVLEVDTLNGIITTIGGNVKNRVNKTLVYLTPNGFIDKDCLFITTDENGLLMAGDQREYFAVIRIDPNWRFFKL